jgi:hypothetical protein
MKTDDFEQKLRQQPLRTVPDGWRAEILAAAAAAAPRPVVREREPSGWAWLLLRFPVAWGAFAAIWIAIFAINAVILRGDIPAMASTPAAPARKVMDSWKLHALALQEMTGEDAMTQTGADNTRQPAALPGRQRSERRGILLLQTASNTTCLS